MAVRRHLALTLSIGVVAAALAIAGYTASLLVKAALFLPLRRELFIVPIAILGVWLAGCTASKVPDLLVEFGRSGGFSGLDDHLAVHEDGRATLVRKTGSREFILGHTVVNQLEAVLKSADFPNLRGEYLPRKSGADMFEYVITYQGRKVRTMDTAVPLSLQPVIELMGHIIDSNGGSQ